MTPALLSQFMCDAHPHNQVEDPVYAVTQLAQTTMRSELGKLSLDRTFQERDSLNLNIVEVVLVSYPCSGLSIRKQFTSPGSIPQLVEHSPLIRLLILPLHRGVLSAFDTKFVSFVKFFFF